MVQQSLPEGTSTLNNVKMESVVRVKIEPLSAEVLLDVKPTFPLEDALPPSVASIRAIDRLMNEQAILERIAGHCKAEIGGRKTLTSLARVAKAFLLPSAAKIWEDLDGLEPLLALLPQHVIRDTGVTSTSPIQSTRGLLIGDIRHQWRFYNRLVKRLHLTAGINTKTGNKGVPQSEISAASRTHLVLGLLRLVVSLPTRPIWVPNLNTLSVFIHCSAMAEVAALLVGRSLRELSLAINFHPIPGEDEDLQDPRAFQCMFEAIQHVSPMLQLVSVMNYGMERYLGNAIGRFLCRLPALTDLRLFYGDGSSLSSWTCLSRLQHHPHLKRLELSKTTPAPYTEHEIPPELDINSFQHLQHVSFQVAPRQITQFLQSVRPPLREVNLSICFVHELQLIDLCYGLRLCYERHRQGPSDITIFFWGPERLQDTTMRKSLENLKAIDLRSLQLISSNHLRPSMDREMLTLDEHILADVALAWPNLAHFKLSGSFSATTLGALQTIAKSCPKLESLCIPPLVATTRPVYLTFDRPLPPANRAMRKLTMGYTGVRELNKKLKKFIAAVWPNAVRVTS